MSEQEINGFNNVRFLFKLHAVYPEEPSFVEMRSWLQCSDGLLASVVKTQLANGFITKQTFKNRGNRPRTIYCLTIAGFQFVERLLKDAQPAIQTGATIQP